MARVTAVLVERPDAIVQLDETSDGHWSCRELDAGGGFSSMSPTIVDMNGEWALKRWMPTRGFDWLTTLCKWELLRRDRAVVHLFRGAAPPAACPDCKGTRVYVGLVECRPCPSCTGGL